MSTIKKFKLTSNVPNEMEFQVTKITVTTVKETRVTDDEGYPISVRRDPIIEITTNQAIEAVSIPSKKPATVEILETDSGENLQIDDQEVRRKGPINLNELMDMAHRARRKGRPANINIDQVLRSDDSRPVTLPPREGPVWADGKKPESYSEDSPSDHWNT